MAAGKGYNHVSAGLEYPKGGRLELDRDPGGQSRGYNMVSLQTFPCHIAGMLAMSCLAGRENRFQQPDRFAGHVGERFHPHSVSL